ncbi:hypothetical protein FRB98_006250 [Tulasnella sp. 332]|nr:hypothetical protein FRB98_006250 [Tulasnella sp. 332]
MVQNGPRCVDVILHLLDNLVDLGLYTTPGPGPYRFRLESLAIDSRFLTLFLPIHTNSQPSTRTLRVRSGLSRLSLRDEVKPISLPNLENFGGKMNTARHFAPGNPVSSLHIDPYAISTTLEALKNLSYKISVPIITLSITGANLSPRFLRETGKALSQLQHLGLGTIDQVNLDRLDRWAAGLSNFRDLPSLGCRLGTWARLEGFSIILVKTMAPSPARTLQTDLYYLGACDDLFTSLAAEPIGSDGWGRLSR